MIDRYLRFLYFGVVLAALFGCDPIHYRLQGHIWFVEDGIRRPASGASVTLNCPKVLPVNREVKADERGFYSLDGTGVLQGCTLSAHHVHGKASTLLGTADIIDQAYPLSPLFRKDLEITKGDDKL